MIMARLGLQRGVAYAWFKRPPCCASSERFAKLGGVSTTPDEWFQEPPVAGGTPYMMLPSESFRISLSRPTSSRTIRITLGGAVTGADGGAVAVGGPNAESTEAVSSAMALSMVGV